jgi:hypothetical protein
MPPLDGVADLVRIVIGRSGRVGFRTELVVRFDYGKTVPWVSRLEDGTIDAIAGPERLVPQTPTKLYGQFLLSRLTGAHSRAPLRRSIPSRRLSARKPFGANGAIGVPTLALGLTQSSGRSSH